MSAHRTLKRLAHLARVGFLSLAQAANEKPEEKEKKEHSTETPIRHVIIIVGENRSFDHLFATYKPKHGQKVDNLLSRGIVKEDGTPGPNFSLALQYEADVSHDPVFELAPSRKTPYTTLPPALSGGPSDVCKDNGVCTLDDAITSENGLAQNYYSAMLTGGTGQQFHVPDMRIANVNDLPPGPFQISGSNFHYDEYAASPVHRFYQMWQQLDCDASRATEKNPSGCKADLFPWVEVTVGAGTNGAAQATDFNNRSTGEGHGLLQSFDVPDDVAPAPPEKAGPAHRLFRANRCRDERLAPILTTCRT
jgi:phospholipase C